MIPDEFKRLDAHSASTDFKFTESQIGRVMYFRPEFFVTTPPIMGIDYAPKYLLAAAKGCGLELSWIGIKHHGGKKVAIWGLKNPQSSVPK